MAWPLRGYVFLLPVSTVHAFGPLFRMFNPRRTFTAAITASDVLRAPSWPKEWPFSATDFTRSDESRDALFYDGPRLCYHIDDSAVGALTKYYASSFAEYKSPPDVLDICSSWVSHYPKDVKLGKLTSFDAKDLNIDPTLPYPENSFDVVTCVVSIDYLNKPLEVSREVCRVLKPGGRAIFSISNRCFPSKVIQIWLQTNDMEHVFIVGSYFHYAGGFEPPSAIDISPNPGRSDPMYIIQARKPLK